MAIIDVNELKLRLCALEVEALNALTPAVPSEAYPRWAVRNETFPYWVNRISTAEGGITDTDDSGEDFRTYIYVVTSSLVVAQVTADLAGEIEGAIDDYLPQVIEYIDARELLQSATYTTAMTAIRRAYFVNGLGFATAPLSAGGVPLVRAEFTWRAEFTQYITQAYL